MLAEQMQLRLALACYLFTPFCCNSTYFSSPPRAAALFYLYSACVPQLTKEGCPIDVRGLQVMLEYRSLVKELHRNSIHSIISIRRRKG